jgi:hypothetical protein
LLGLSEGIQLESERMDEKTRWARMADEWLVAYAYVLGGTVRTPGVAFWPAPHLFLLGHALELCFKACLMQQGVTPWGHNLSEMWLRLKKDPQFLPNVSIRREHFDSFSVKDYGTFPVKYSGDPVMYYTQLILIMKFGTGDLKYLGTELPNVPMPYLVNWVSHDPALMRVFKGLRQYVERQAGSRDQINELLALPSLMMDEREFLEGVAR